MNNSRLSQAGQRGFFLLFFFVLTQKRTKKSQGWTIPAKF
jgi:hypothetical protein